LGGEVSRSTEVVRETATTGFLKLVELIAGQLEGLSPAAAKNEALFMLTSMIGAVTMARVVTDPGLSATILRQARKHLTP